MINRSEDKKSRSISNDPIAGTTDQLPRWEGPPENRPRGYLPATDNPDVDRDAAGQSLTDPDRKGLTDAGTEKGG